MARAAGVRVPTVVVNAAMVWAVLATTIPYLSSLGIEISRTRELFTVYLLAGLAMAGGWWHGAGRPVVGLVGVFAGFSVIGTITWTVAYSWDLALNFWAEWLLAAAMLMFGLAFARRHGRMWSTFVVVYGAVLAAVQLASLMFDTTAGLLPSSGGPAFYGYRPLAASVALFLVLAFALAIFASGPVARFRVWLVSLLGISVILSQNRSAWLALLVVIVGCVIAFVRRPDLRGRWPGVVATVSFFAAALAVPLVSGVSLLPGSVAESDRGLPESATSVITSEWRIEMWQSRLGEPRSLVEWLTGGVFGPTPVKGPGSDVMNPLISGHNVMVDVLTMLGVLGLVAVFVLWLWGVIRTSDRLAALPLFLWGLMAYGMFYNWPAWSWAVLASALATGWQEGPGPALDAQSPKVATSGG